MGAPKGNKNAKDNHTKKIKTEEELEQKIKKYFEECDKNEEPYSMGGLADTLDIDRSTLVRYGNDENDIEYANLIKKAKRKVERQLEVNALKGKSNPVFTIFNLKNNYGWRDQQEVKMTNEIENLDTLADMLGFGKND